LDGRQGEDKKVRHRYIDNKAGGEQHKDRVCIFINTLQPLLKPKGQKLIKGRSREGKPQTFYHHVDRVCTGSPTNGFKSAIYGKGKEGRRKDDTNHCLPYLTRLVCHHR
jgi:hypothetical protein